MKYLIILVFLVGCTSTTELEIEHKQEPYKIVLPDVPVRPKFVYYDVKFTQEQGFDYKCFDQSNTNKLNENYFRMWSYAKELERENKYLREQILKK